MESKPKRNNINSILSGLIIAVLLFGSGYKLGELQTKTEVTNKKLVNTFTNAQVNNKYKIDFDLYWDILEKLDTKYVDKSKLDPQKLFYGSLKGLVAALDDPYSFFLTPEDNKNSKDDLSGRFEGIGAQLGLKNNSIVVIAPLKNSPAEKAGVRAGDYILKVDGKSTSNWTLIQAVSKIRGKQGTPVKLALFREPQKEFEVTITRQQIHVDSVELTYEDGTAIIKVNQFGETTNEEWDRAVEQVAQRYSDGSVNGLLVDMRDNPGGFLDSAVYLASDFIKQGEIIVKQESTNEAERTYRSSRTPRLPAIPLVILINKGSASASEIFSGAMRDYKRATLVGEKSFGKGSVQEALDLQDGTGLHVTIAKWILPKGEWINGKGIEPDITVVNEVPENNTITRETDKQLTEAVKQVNAK